MQKLRQLPTHTHTHLDGDPSARGWDKKVSLKINQKF